MIGELVYDDPIAEQPLGSKIALKRHQLSLLHKVLNTETNKISISSQKHIETKIGIIGDKVGSGKSYVMLGTILSGCEHLRKQTSTYKSYASGMITCVNKEENVQDNNTLGRNVVVVPHNLVKQWEEYINRFYESDLIKTKIIQKNKHVDELTKEDLQNSDIILVSSTMYPRFSYLDIVTDTYFARVIYDEAHAINLPACKKIRSSFYWFMTASINDLIFPVGRFRYVEAIQKYVENGRGIRTTGFIKDIFMSLIKVQDVCNAVICKNNDAYVDASLLLPEIIKTVIECATSGMITMLHDYVNRDVMRCLHAHDFQRAIEHLSSSHKNTEDNIINVLLEKYSKNINVIDAKIQYAQTIIYNNPTEQKADIDKLKNEREVNFNTMQSIRDRVKNSSFCPICYQDYDNKTVLRCCQNSFCFECLSKWLIKKEKCPMCNQRATTDDMFVIKEEENVCDHVNIPLKLGKFESAVDIIKNKPNGKFLILSAFEEPLHNLSTMLVQDDITYSYLKGNHYCIENTINKYRGNEIDVLLINPKHSGCGLNLEMTTDIILFHQLDTEMEKQIVGRAHRLGRNGPLNVWYLLHTNEIVSAR
jgi:SNF2 family DNA or RNA helicase